MRVTTTCIFKYTNETKQYTFLVTNKLKRKN